MLAKTVEMKELALASFLAVFRTELSSLGASRALDVTTLDVKDGKDKQDEAYQIWEEIIVGMEKDRLEGWESKSK